MGLINDNQRPKMNIRNQNYTLGDLRAKMLSNGMKSMKNGIEKINMAHNNLTNEGAYNIMDSVG
jgi:hypothetical protein